MPAGLGSLPESSLARSHIMRLRRENGAVAEKIAYY